mmetsp:Transcript_2510/g.5991  ORF Transcript_2510/g.5991 Transcript_2510/m.5991 type:complete len:93 (-) Transcript_2510:1-279(-)
MMLGTEFEAPRKHLKYLRTKQWLVHGRASAQPGGLSGQGKGRCSPQFHHTDLLMPLLVIVKDSIASAKRTSLPFLTMMGTTVASPCSELASS